MSLHADPSVWLESGDHLTREELHRRYLVRPDIKKAELVEGVVWVGGRVRAREHAEPNADGIIESANFAGLRLHVPSMLAGDMRAVLAALRAVNAPDQP